MGTGEHRVKFGVTTPGGPAAIEEIDAVTAMVGEAPEYLLWYQDFGSEPPAGAPPGVQHLDATPVITWEPWTRADRGPGTMRGLASGALDEYVHKMVAELRHWQRPIYLRFAHEFNGNWYPWSPAGGTSATDYVGAWRRIHQIFADEGACNVQWMWCSNAGGPHDPPITDWYPGDAYVDCLGIDGYNWGTSRPGTTWRGPEEVFATALTETVAMADGRPVLVSEVGCTEHGGNKADWITAFVDHVTEHPPVTGFIWFEHDKETDWRIASTPQSGAAMAEALRARR